MGGQTLAAIDVGSNTVRLLIAEVERLPRQRGSAGPGLNQGSCANWQIRRLRAEIRTTRLGERQGARAEPGFWAGLGPSFISLAALERTVAALKEYQEIVASYRPAGVWAVGTSALREAANREEVLVTIAKETGFAVEIIDGAREGELGYRGASLVLAEERMRRTWAQAGWDEAALTLPPVVIDIGGGSTEITASKPGGGPELQVLSFPLGSVRCTRAATTLAEAQALLEDGLVATGMRLLPSDIAPASRPVIGIGGTITALGAMDLGLKSYDPGQVHGHILRRSAVKEWWERLALAAPAERQELLAFDPPRAEIITAGAMILYAVLLVLGVGQVIVSDTGLLHGMLISFNPTR